ncbi:MAG: hypothetical protein II882_07745 [Lachnospiraceae bacterium]|nr:hypothetical protein [Lachnospiraceae bacterium]
MIGIHIYGVHPRMANMQENAAKLPGAHIHIDDLYGKDHGCYPSLYTCRKAFLAPLEEGETHWLVLQDDVELCDNFFEILQRIVKAHPDEILGLFPYNYLKRGPILDSLPTPYIRSQFISGQAIVVPVWFIPLWDRWVRSAHPKGDIPDDTSIRLAAEGHKIRWLTTIPSTVQHIGDDSILNASMEPRRTEYYSKNPQADWENPNVAPIP